MATRPGGYVPIRDRRAELVFLAVCSAALVLHALSFRYTVDDAFISFRYADRWVHGDGLVFNPGEKVEGYTNFLWTVWIALGLRLGFDPIHFSRVTGVLSGVALLWAAYSFARPSLTSRSLAFLLPVPIVANGAFALWCGAGLETSLFALLVFTGVAVAAGAEDGRRFAAASCLLALSALARPEGVLIFAVILFDRLLLRRVPFRASAAGIVLFGLLVGAHETWRIAYYGDVLPNAFHAKTGGGFRQALRGLGHVGRYFGPFGGWTAVAPLPLLLSGRPRPAERTLLLVSFVYLAYVAAVGGDSLPFFRFIVPVIPLLAVLAVFSLDRLSGRGRLAPAGIRLAAIALLLALPLWNSVGGEAHRFLAEDRERVELHWKVIGKWLGSHAREGESIAVTTAGAIPYYSGLPTIDMLGINDRAIARRRMPGMGEGIAGHEKHDMAYVLARRPTYILHYPFLLPEPVFAVSQFRTPWNLGLAGLLENETFDRAYRGESAEIVPPGTNRPLYLVYFHLKEGGAR